MNRKTILQRLLALLAMAAMCVDTGCGVMHKWGKDLGAGALDKVDERGAPTVHRLVNAAGASLRDSVLDVATEARLHAIAEGLVDSIMAHLSIGTDAWLDSNEPRTTAWVERVRNAAIGPNAQRELAALRGELIGEETKRRGMQLIDSIVAAATGRLQTDLPAIMRNPATIKAARGLVDTLIAAIATDYRTKLRPEFDKHVGFIEVHAKKLIVFAVVLGLLVALIIFVVYRRYRRMLDVVTREIEVIPDRQAYDELTKRIRAESLRNGLGPALHREVARHKTPNAWTPGGKVAHAP